MAITPADIEQMTFSEAKKHGYSTEEVDAFLDQLASEVDAMLQKIADLKGRLNNSEQQLAAAQAQVAQLKEQSASSAAIEPAPVPAAPVADYGASERQISQVLIVAQQSADKLLADARANADNIRNEADQKAREVIRQALAEKQNELDEIDRLKQSREDFRSEYKKMLQHFMDDADSVFPEKTLSTHWLCEGLHLPAPRSSRRLPWRQPAAPAVDAQATTFAPAPTDTDFSDLD